jgi:hypothetical protein
VLKRLTRIAITFAALVAGYLGYVQGFAFVEDRVPTPEGVAIVEPLEDLSQSEQERRRLALTAFGPGHWTIDATINFYSAPRGYYIFAREYTPLDGQKKLKLRPFAVIWRDRKGKALKTLTADEATLVFDKPLTVVRGPGESSARIVRGELKGGIVLRDDKGTPGELGDDLTITGPGDNPLNYLAYSEAESTIKTDQPILIRERDTIATSDQGLILTLRPKAAPEPGVMPGYDGAKTIEMLGHIYIYTRDVGRAGLVPGGAVRAAKEAVAGAVTLDEAGAPTEPGTPAPTAPESKPRPGEIFCDNGVKVDLPEPKPLPPVGPPEPQGPTFATFLRNVRIRQGDPQEPEQIDGDRMDLTLVPAAKSNQTVASEDGGPLSSLTLRKAKVTGHAVWLQSVAQHVVGKGNLLIYERGTPEAPNGRTFFRGAQEAEVRRENVEEGTVDVMHSFDITIFHDGPKGEVSSVVVGGPGWMQTRRKDDHALLHAAAWQNRAVIQPIANDPTRRQLTLEGRPQVEDPLRGTLHTSQAIVAILASKPGSEARIEGATADPQVAQARLDNAAAVAAAGATDTPGEPGRGPLRGGSYRIELLRAYRDAVLVSYGAIDGAGTPADPDAQKPSPRTFHARSMLVAHFEEAAPTVVAADPSADAEPEIPPAAPYGAVAAKPDAEPAAEVADADADAKPEPEPKPADPPLTVEADTIWAWVVQEPADPSEPNKQKGTLREARLRDGVVIHQDKAPDGSKGFDVNGDRVDLVGRGEKLFEVRAYADGSRIAKVATDTFSIEGHKLGLDQESNYAVVIGDGMLVQQGTGGNLLGDTLPGRDPDAREGGPADPDAPKKPRKPMHISWGRDAEGRPILDAQGRPVESWMKFYGITRGEDGGVAPAQANFYNHVRAWTDDSMLLCGRLVADFDAPVDFRKARLAPGARGPDLDGDAPADPGAESDAMPKIAEAHAHALGPQDVKILVRRLNPEGEVLEKQYLHAKDASYDKRTNSFEVPSQGVVYMYNHKKPPKPAGADAAARPAAAPQDLGPLQLTRVQFRDGMQGQLNTRQPGSKRSNGQAEFFGNVRVIEALVPDEDADLSIEPARRPQEFYYTVSDKLRVISEPPPPGAGEDEPDRILVDSWNGKNGRGIYGLVGRPPSNVTAITADDRMTYDSSTGLAVIYGGASGVHIVQQSGVGQDQQYGAGKAVLYNHKTGQNRLIDQRTINLLNPDPGARADSPEPDKKEKKKKEHRDPFPRVGPSDKERRNFTGR